MPTTTYKLQLVEEQADLSTAVIEDVSDYQGELRTDKANFMVISKNDKSGTPTWLTGIDNTLPLSAMEWGFPTIGADSNGWTQFNLIRLALYSSSPISTVQEIVSSGVITQYATVVYHTGTQQVVKAKTTGSVSVQPGETGWQTYWDVVTDLTTLVGYGPINVLQHGDLIDTHLRDGLRDAIDAVNIIPASHDPSDRVKLYERQFQFQLDLDSLTVKNEAEEFGDMEEMARIMVEIYL